MQLEQWLDTQLGQDIWKGKYCFEGETFDEWLDRVSNGDETLRHMIIDKRFLFAGRILANRGLQKKGKKVTYSNCYVIAHPEDNIESIFETAKKLGRTYSYGGGCGTDLHALRPRGATVNNAAEASSGSVSFMDLYDITTAVISQLGRRGALMLSQLVSHPDIFEFVKIKSDLNKITKANISVRTLDDFMEAVVKDIEYTLYFDIQETGERIEKKIKASDLINEIAFQAWDIADPGMLYWDRITKWTLLEKVVEFVFDGVNPCITGDTLVATTEGYIQIKDLVGQQPHVYCMNNEGHLDIVQASKVWLTRKNAQIVKIITGKGEIKCTPDHLIFTTNRGWVQAKDLRRRDKIKGLNRYCVENYTQVALSGDKYIPEHRFIASKFYDIKGKDVHHIDEDTFNNKMSNYKVIPHNKHSKISNNGHRAWTPKSTHDGRFIKKDVSEKSSKINSLNKSVGTNWYVKEVIWLEEQQDVYDMTVPIVHNFIANDMVVHNCGEEPLPAGGSCLLSAHNLSSYVLWPFEGRNSTFDFAEFEKYVKLSVVYMNEVLDEGLELHPLEEQRKSVGEWRQMGIGFMGYADMLIKMGIRYGSPECIELTHKIGHVMINAALQQSALLAKDYGSFPAYERNKEAVWDSEFLKTNATKETMKLIKKHGLRNSQLLTIAPTGSLSTMLGISGGIEPCYDLSFMRKTQSLHGKDVYYSVDIDIVAEYKNAIASSTGVALEHIPLPTYITQSTAKVLNWRERVDVQATWQKYIDASISSTCNLPNETTVEEIKELYIYAWQQGCKGITVYRDGCRKGGILTSGTEKKENSNSEDNSTDSTNNNVINDISSGLKFGDTIAPSDDLIGKKRKLTTGCGTLWVNAYFEPHTGEFREVFLSKGSTGGCLSFTNGLSRMSSLAARKGASVYEVAEQLNSVVSCPSYAVRKATKGDTSPGSSCPVAVGKVLIEMYNECQKELKQQGSASLKLAQPTINSSEAKPVAKPIKNEVKGKDNFEACPICHAELIPMEGCISCKSCGYSRC
jgi:ribonucleotide reductase alpha subunit